MTNETTERPLIIFARQGEYFIGREDDSWLGHSVVEGPFGPDEAFDRLAEIEAARS